MIRRSALFSLISLSLAIIFPLGSLAHPHPELVDPVQDSLVTLHTRPPLNGGKVAMEAVAGVAVGVTCAYTGALIGVLSNDADGYEDLGPAIVGFLVGGTIGNAIGIYAVGVSGEDHGSFATTLAGSAAGTVGMIGLLAAADGADGGEGLTILALSLPVVGGILGFNQSRTYESQHYSDHAEHVWDQAPGSKALEKLHDGSEAKGHQFKILSTAF